MSGITLREARELIAARYSEPGGPTTPDREPENKPEPVAKVERVKYNPYRRESDPSADELRRLSADQLLRLEETEPGITDRLQDAAAWDQASSTQHSRDQADRVRAAYDQRVQSDPEFLTSELQRQARENLEVQWDHVSDEERRELAAEAGVDAEGLAEMTRKREATSVQAELSAAGITDASAYDDFISGRDALPPTPFEGPTPPDGTDNYNKAS